MNPIYEMIGHYVRRLHQISIGAFSRRVSEADIELTQVQFAALSVISEAPGIDQTALSRNIAYDRATIGGVIDRLERKGFIYRSACRHDRRVKGLFITELGSETYQKTIGVAWVVQKDIVHGLDEKEREELLRLLIKATESSNHFSRAPLKKGYPQ